MNEKTRVLIVDDSVGIRQTMSMILTRKGFDVACAADGSEALKMVKERPFDKVLLDIRLPGIDGVDVNKNIQSMQPHPRVAMITAYADESKVRAALEAGAEKVFYKPLDLEAVISYIQQGA